MNNNRSLLLSANKFFLLIFAVGFCFTSILTVPAKANIHRDSINIYFLENRKFGHKGWDWDQATTYDQNELRKAVSTHKPFITIDDIRAYEWNQHYMFISQSAWMKINTFIHAKKRRWPNELYFILQVNNEPLYYGFFVRTIDSAIVPHPWIYLDFFSEKRKLAGVYSFPIYYADIGRNGKPDPRRSPALHKVLNRNGKIVYYDHPTICILVHDVYE